GLLAIGPTSTTAACGPPFFSGELPGGRALFLSLGGCRPFSGELSLWIPAGGVEAAASSIPSCDGVGGSSGSGGASASATRIGSDRRILGRLLNGSTSSSPSGA